jgi:cellulose synthase/poly-beta-1,6-N-acetylglucosamine synthase-like glycosyltransferase/phosphoglycerol transferase MdoB-like AlkP superfamily enzyme
MWKHILYDLFSYGILVYSLTILASYIFIAAFAIGETKKYLRKDSFTDYSLLASSPYTPSLSILAPAYNEGLNIVENVRSLLSINYTRLELIVINDGSKDDSVQQLIRAYDLHQVQQLYSGSISTKKIRAVYKSRNPVYDRLVVIDKENGGKADALNVGINLASSKYIVCIDVDCILEQDALLKLVKPFMEETTQKVIATGGVIRVANSCVFENGKLVEVKLPKQFLPRVQTLEYIRAFLLSRMAWSRMNGLLIISGAFGAFDREIVKEVGGYSTNTVGEDMELVVKMRAYMEEKKIPYKVAYIPDPLCWTEAPATYKILGRQRNRWTRGTIETLKTHRKLFFNPKFGVLGMLSYPFWFFFEFLAPLIEFIGLVAFVFFVFIGMINWPFFLALLVFILLFGWLYSIFAILMEVLTYNQYKKRGEITKLLLTALAEPFAFHPFVVWFSIKGNIDLLRKQKGWGEMTRQGLVANHPTNTAAGRSASDIAVQAPSAAQEAEHLVQVPDNYVSKEKTTFLQRLKNGLQEAAVYIALLLLTMMLVKAYELIKDIQLHGTPQFLTSILAVGFLNEFSFVLNIAIFPAIIFTVIYLLHKNTARFLFVLFSVIIVVIQAALSQYFLETLVPLGADLWNYSFSEIKQTVGAAGSVTVRSVVLALFTIAFTTFSFVFIPKKFKPGFTFSLALFFTCIACTLFSLASVTNGLKPGQEFTNNLALNKSFYFYKSSLDHLQKDEAAIEPITNSNSNSKVKENVRPVEDSSASGIHYVDENHYPFLHTVDTTADVLSPFFNTQPAPPNIVFIIVEGLGRAFSNKNAYLGSFTPFLDSLSGKSLYWSNFLSAGGRTFAMLPSVFGSLPFAKNGFLEMGDKMPRHQSLLSALKQQGYKTGFYYGGNASFDHMSDFLKMNGATIYDQKSFSNAYQQMPSNGEGFSWGFGDEEVFRKLNEVNSSETKPSCNIVLTLSTHSPFLIKNEDKYLQLFEQRMQTLGFDEAKKEEYRHYQNQYATILYMDNAVKNFIANYSKRADFGNTIFIITGDHRMPEIPMSTKIDRYHVPLIIYSPLLKQSKHFESVSSHLDIAPSLISFLSHQYHFPMPSQATWLGSGLDTASAFRNIHAYPLMQTKNEVSDFVMDDYLLNGDDLYKMSDNMGLEPANNEAEKKKMLAAFQIFRQKNNMLINGAPLQPNN